MFCIGKVPVKFAQVFGLQLKLRTIPRSTNLRGSKLRHITAPQTHFEIKGLRRALLHSTAARRLPRTNRPDPDEVTLLFSVVEDGFDIVAPRIRTESVAQRKSMRHATHLIIAFTVSADRLRLHCVAPRSRGLSDRGGSSHRGDLFRLEGGPSIYLNQDSERRRRRKSAKPSSIVPTTSPPKSSTDLLRAYSTKTHRTACSSCTRATRERHFANRAFEDSRARQAAYAFATYAGSCIRWRDERNRSSRSLGCDRIHLDNFSRTANPPHLHSLATLRLSRRAQDSLRPHPAPWRYRNCNCNRGSIVLFHKPRHNFCVVFLRRSRRHLDHRINRRFARPSSGNPDCGADCKRSYALARRMAPTNRGRKRDGIPRTLHVHGHFRELVQFSRRIRRVCRKRRGHDRAQLHPAAQRHGNNLSATQSPGAFSVHVPALFFSTSHLRIFTWVIRAARYSAS